MDIATWSQEYFGKSLSLNTVCRCIKKCNLKLYYAKRKAFINFVQKRHWVLWAQSHLRRNERQWKHVLRSQESTFQPVFGKNGHRILRDKDEKKPSKLLPTKSAKTSLCDGMGVHQCPQHEWAAYMWRCHWYGGLCWNFGDAAVKMNFPGTPCLFQPDNAKPHSAQVTIAWLGRHRVHLLD